MDAVAVVARLALALVFTVAAVAKVTDTASFRRILRLYGVPGAAFRTTAIAVPAVELAVALALVPAELAPWGAVAALALLGAFTAVTAVGRVRAIDAACACFGPLDPLSTGFRPFIRNAALAALAAAAALVEADGARQATSAPIVVGFAAAAAALATWVAARTRARRGRAAVGAPAPTAVFRTLAGDTIDLRGADGTPTLLLFWNPSCVACKYMLPRLKAWEDDPPPGSPRLVIASSGSEDDNRAAGLASPIVLEQFEEARNAFEIPGTPAAILIDAEGRIASEPILGAPAILSSLGAPP